MAVAGEVIEAVSGQSWEEFVRERILTRVGMTESDVLPLALDDAAYVFVRIGESVLYSDLLGGREPDLALAAQVQRSLLRPVP